MSFSVKVYSYLEIYRNSTNLSTNIYS